MTVALRKQLAEMKRECARLRKAHDAALKRASDARSDTVLKAQARGRHEGWQAAIEQVMESTKDLAQWFEFMRPTFEIFTEKLAKLRTQYRADPAGRRQKAKQ